MNDSNKILWIGTIASEEVISKGYRQVAANIAQNYFIEGLEKITGTSVDILSALRLPDYPQYKEIIIHKDTTSHKFHSNDVNVGFLNLKYVSHLSRSLSLKKEAQKWANRNHDKKVTVIVYSLHSPFILAALQIKKLIPNARIFAIVADLPLNMDMSSFIKRELKKIDWKYMKKILGGVDGYILYTRYMADYLDLTDDKWIVVEGMINQRKLQVENKLDFKYKKKVCMYAGTLKKIYKINLFTQAFIQADIPDCELHIYGRGDFETELKKICESYSNVKYLGFMPSDYVFQEATKATLLVNPRPTRDEYTKYSCPSKTFEYMASGTPLLTTKLAGIPDEYFDYTYTFDDETVDGMANTLKRILEKDRRELHEKGELAREFIRNHKNNNIQCDRILQFIKEKE